MQSTNWSGYVATATGARFTEARGSWTVPAVRPGPAGYSSSWVGIDGTSTQDLIQAGTEQDWGPQGVVYYAWYEMLPASSVYLGPVYPGDQMSVEIAKAGPASWVIDVYDLTRDKLWTGAVSYSAPGNSAEWVEEAPTNGQTSLLYPLADFGAVQFSGLGVGGPGTAQATVSPVYMVAGATGLVEAYPDRYSRAQDSFSVQFGTPSTNASGLEGWPAEPLGNPPGPAGPATGGATPAGTGAKATARGQGAAPPRPLGAAPAASSTAPGPGYWLVAGDGGVFAFGSARYGGSAAAVFAKAKTAGVTGIAAAAKGYWLVTTTGGVFPLGGAPYLGSVASLNLSAGKTPAIAASPNGPGYYILAPWGDVFAFGAAHYEGSCDPARCGRRPAVAIVPDSSGDGYWLLLAGCQAVAFGDAPALGDPACQEAASAPGAQVVGAGRAPDGKGFWALLANGAIYPFGDAASYGDWYRNAIAGTTPGLTTPAPPRLGSSPAAVAIVPTSDGKGAWVVGADGSVENLGDAPYLGALPVGTRLNQPVLSAAGA